MTSRRPVAGAFGCVCTRMRASARKSSAAQSHPESADSERSSGRSPPSMNAATAATCLLAAGLGCFLYGSSDLLSSLLRVSVAETSMPEPAAAPRRSPQGVPYSELRHIVNADGLHLFCRYWEPDGPPRSVNDGGAAGGGGECGGEPFYELRWRSRK